MDESAVLAELDEFIAVAEALARHAPGGTSITALNQRLHQDVSGLDDELVARVELVKRLVAAIDPNLMSGGFLTSTWRNGYPDWSIPLRTVRRARSLVEHSERITQMLGPTGPQIFASQLHVWVWEAAAALWDGEFHREAVQAAATRVELELRRKLGTDGDALDLVNAFRVDGKKSQIPRLRRPGFDPGTKDFTSAHDGAANYGAGCIQAIRNISTHRLELEHALEMLAALSLLAHWISTSVVEPPAHA